MQKISKREAVKMGYYETIAFLLIIPSVIIFHEFGHAIFLSRYNKTGERLKLGYRRNINKSKLKKYLGFNTNVFYIEVPDSLVLNDKQCKQVYLGGIAFGFIPLLYFFDQVYFSIPLAAIIIFAYLVGVGSDLKELKELKDEKLDG